MTRFSNFIALAGITALIAGCGGDTESKEAQMEAQAKRHGVDADVELGKNGDVERIVVTTGLGGQYGQNIGLPGGFPDDVAVPDQWNITMSTSVPGTDGYSIQALSDAGTDEMLAEIRATMQARGWSEVAMATLTPQLTKIDFEKDGRMANFNITDAGESTAVQVLTMTKP